MNGTTHNANLSDKYRGANKCVRTIGVFPACEGLIEAITEHLLPFNCEFGNHDTKMVFSIDISLRLASYLCDKFNLGRFVLIRLHDNGMVAEGYVQVLSDRYKFKEQKQQCVMVDSMEEVPYNRCVKNGCIDLKGKMLDIRIPFDDYCQLVKRMDDMITERKQKYEMYDLLYESYLNGCVADWVVPKEQHYFRSALFSTNYYKHFRSINKDEE